MKDGKAKNIRTRRMADPDSNTKADGHELQRAQCFIPAAVLTESRLTSQKTQKS